uniref:C2H2-type domain-containing protein n=1 Tax=Caenorhabditis elegans TaxID=6239 RepID=UPI00389B3B33
SHMSFAFPLVQSPNKQKEEMNKVHNIKCHFDNCNRKIHWKIRYGKLRLVDHALSHQEEKSIDCQKCEYSCQTTRQMRYHYKKIHANLKMEGFGILNIPLQNTKFSDVWNKCFGDQLKTIGPVRK